MRAKVRRAAQVKELAALAALGMVVVTSCAPAAQPGASLPASNAAQQTTTGTTSWDQTVAAATQEGTVVILGPPGDAMVAAMTQGFEQTYPGIKVDYSAPPTAQIAPKLNTELAAGENTTDVLLVGTTTVLSDLRPANDVAPIQPYLTGPDEDPAQWMGGKWNFADTTGQYDLDIGIQAYPPFVYNPNLVSSSEFTSWRDLLDPKWQGKITMVDPEQSGSGLGVVAFWWANPALGKDYVQQMMSPSTGLVLSRDGQQVLDWVARGEHPIAIGPDSVLAYEMRTKGLPIEFMPSDAMKEGGLTTTGNGSLAVIRDPPHPHATQVYLDYLLSQAGQLAWSKASGLASRRMDVPRDHLLPATVPQDGGSYIEISLEPYVTMRADVVSYLKGVEQE